MEETKNVYLSKGLVKQIVRSTHTRVTEVILNEFYYATDVLASTALI